MITLDILLGVYLILAITAFNRPDELSDVCSEVKISIQEGVVKGFLTADEIKHQLRRANLYPLGEQMERIKTRQIEDALRQNPFVKEAECYKTQTGHVMITLVQRMPVVRVKSDYGTDYYVDENGNIMPDSQFASDLVVATGSVSKQYAQKVLCAIGCYLLQHPLWRSQVEQLHVLPDGSVEMVPRVGDHIIYLGQPVNLDRKLSRLEKFYRYGLPHAGWNKYSYISVEFDNQIICKKRGYKGSKKS